MTEQARLGSSCTGEAGSSDEPPGSTSMGEAIGQLLRFAVGVALSPTPIIAMILMLITPRARANGFVFVLGWLLGVIVAGAICLALASPTDAGDGGEPANWVSWLKLALGVLLLLVA